MTNVTDHGGEVDGMPAFWRTAPAANPDAAPILWLHGVPTSSDDWLPFLEVAGGIAPDLPGFGRSTKRGDLAYDIPFYAKWIDDFLTYKNIDKVRLVVHDWGGVGLAWAQANPDRVERLVVMDSVPFLPGYKWHRMAKIWRTPFLGELAMGFTSKRTLRWISRESNATPGPLPQELIEQSMSHFDLGTQRAILALYRSAPANVLEAAGKDLGKLTCPALVLWGDKDPYIPKSFADAYGQALPGATVEHIADAGHWPWLDKPELVGTVSDFLTA
jgi:pimeloyl-ACP methyl ester carboxylesterase